MPSRTGGIEVLLRQGIIEEMAKIERVPSRTGGREGLLWQRIIEEMAKMRECQQNRLQRGTFVAGDHRGGGKD